MRPSTRCLSRAPVVPADPIRTSLDRTAPFATEGAVVVRRGRARVLAATAFVLGAALTVGGCSTTNFSPSPATKPTPATTPTEPTPTAERTVRAQSSLDAWLAAARSGDAAAARAAVSDRDPAFAERVSRLQDTLRGLPLASVSARLNARTPPLPRARQALLGPTAWVQEVTLSWRLTGETVSASHRVWLTFVSDGGAVLLAGTTDGDSSGPQPLWWTEPVMAASTQGSVALVSGDDADSAARARTWSARASAAAREVGDRISPARRWPARLVIEVPQDQADFERVLGVRPGSYASIAAVAWPEGPDPATAALRVVVNPGLVGELAGGLSAEGVAILLTHEVTHVATRSAASRAPTWLVEGYADAIAYAAHPSTVKTAAAVALDDVAKHGAPAALPVDADFAPGAARLDLTYARSWLACRYVAESTSVTNLNRLYDAVDGGSTLDAALKSVLGVDQATFLRDWRAWLSTAAKNR